MFCKKLNGAGGNNDNKNYIPYFFPEFPGFHSLVVNESREFWEKIWGNNKVHYKNA